MSVSAVDCDARFVVSVIGTFGSSAASSASACATCALAWRSATSRSEGSRRTRTSPALTVWFSTTRTARTVPATRALMLAMFPSICASSVSSKPREWM